MKRHVWFSMLLISTLLTGLLGYFTLTETDQARAGLLVLATACSLRAVLDAFREWREASNG